MQNNYDGEGKETLMVSCPKVIEFEIMVLEWAIELLKNFSKQNVT